MHTITTNLLLLLLTMNGPESPASEELQLLVSEQRSSSISSSHFRLPSPADAAAPHGLTLLSPPMVDKEEEEEEAEVHEVEVTVEEGELGPVEHDASVQEGGWLL